jgi:hypothetical protein
VSLGRLNRTKTARDLGTAGGGGGRERSREGGTAFEFLFGGIPVRQVEVLITHSELAQERWRFWYNDREHCLVLSYWVRESRPSVRHKFRIESEWDAHSSRRRNVERPQIPESVCSLTLGLFTADLRVGYL